MIAEIRVEADAVGAGFVEFDVLSDPYRPSAHGGGNDDRELGVVLLGVEFQPEIQPRVGGTSRVATLKTSKRRSIAINGFAMEGGRLARRMSSARHRPSGPL